MEYVLYIVVMIGVFATLSLSLELVTGQAGLISVTQAAFYGIGAYASALISTQFQLSFLCGVLAGAVLAAAASFMISIPSLRLRDDYFVIATFAFQMILFGVLNNWIDVTRGPLGISGIPRPVLFGWTVTSTADYAVLAFCVASLAYLVVAGISGSPFGRVLHAIREDDIFAESLGKNTRYFKITAFAVSAVLAAIAGSLYAHFITFIDPTSFSIMESILVLSMVIIGGAGNLLGSLLGAAVLVVLPELLRLVGLPTAEAAIIRQIIYGALLVLMMMIRPQGLLGRYEFGR